MFTGARPPRPPARHKWRLLHHPSRQRGVQRRQHQSPVAVDFDELQNRGSLYGLAKVWAEPQGETSPLGTAAFAAFGYWWPPKMTGLTMVSILAAISSAGMRSEV